MFHDKVGVMDMHKYETMEVSRDGFHDMWEDWNLVKDKKRYWSQDLYENNIS